MSLQGTASHLFSTLEKRAYLGFVHLTVSHLGEPWDCWAYVNRGGQPCMSHEKWLLCGCLHSPLENTSTALAAKAAPLHCQVVQCNGVLPRISSHLQDILPGEANTDLTTLQRALMTLENNCKQDRGWLWRMHRRKKTQPPSSSHPDLATQHQVPPADDAAVLRQWAKGEQSPSLPDPGAPCASSQSDGHVYMMGRTRLRGCKSTLGPSGMAFCS